MAAPCAQVGVRLHCSGRVILNKLETWRQLRSFSRSLLSRQTATENAGPVQEIVIPKKKTWDKLAVLQALASTVNRDPTAAHYMFQDDPYLTPRTSPEFKLYSLSQESGRNAAKYIVNTYPRFFQKDFAEPHIPCLMPTSVEPQIGELSEAALRERVQLRRVKAAVDVYDQLLQAGTAVSLETTNSLLDLICLYGDKDPVREDDPEAMEAGDVEETQDDTRRRKGRLRKASDVLGVVWRENNNAERIFNLMPERNEQSYCALIKGMVKYGAYTKAFNVYTDLLNNRMTADVCTFNALIAAAPELKEKYQDKWALITDLLKHMSEQKVQPNLLTFNAVLKALRKCGPLGRVQSLLTLGEIKALAIEPSLATYDHLIGIFYKAASTRGPTEILHEVMDEVEGKSFVAQDPDDVYFFSDAMRICLELKDLELAYRLNRFLGVGDNWQLLGDFYQQNYYYGRFFTLLCIMENLDVVMKWYRDLIPSLYYPNSQGMMDLLQALDTDNRLDLIPEIWKDIKKLGHANKAELVEEVLAMMAREQHSPEVQESFADCALAVRAAFAQGDGGRFKLEWTASSLGNIATLLLRAGRTGPAWEMLQLFKANNRVPGVDLVTAYLNCAKVKNNSAQAVELVRLSSGYSLPITAKLACRVKEEFELTNEQKQSLAEFEALTSDSDSDSDSESDKE
ncbi:small ribosomal subunit protein mS39 [Amia ocellicauda]|uniref:small ribosomal subunit protein mS39 n=1 Tax=Amia ocellicauda TaxID=2972642 RepID=UPI003463AB8B